MKLPQLPQDKANHFAYGALICLVLLLALSPLLAVSAAIGVGAVKEVYDRISGTGTADALDAAATAVGALVVFAATFA